MANLTILRQKCKVFSDRVEEAEAQIEQVEGWVGEATKALSSCLEQRRVLQQKLMDLESRSRRNNICIFRVAEGEEENSVPQFIEKLLKCELPLLQDMDLKIQRAHLSLVKKCLPKAIPRPIIINFQEYEPRRWF